MGTLLPVELAEPKRGRPKGSQRHRQRLVTGRGSGRKPKQYGNKPPETSPEEIAAACEEIQKRWTPGERFFRQHGVRMRDIGGKADIEAVDGWQPQVFGEALFRGDKGIKSE